MRRGLADFDIRQNFVLDALWTLPRLLGERPISTALSSGWQLGSIFQASTGTPFTATVSGDPMGLKPHAGDTYDIADRVAAPGCAMPVGLVRHSGANPTYIRTECFGFPGKYLGNAGRNSLIGPGLYDLDFSLFKNTPLN